MIVLVEDKREAIVALCELFGVRRRRGRSIQSCAFKDEVDATPSTTKH
jgi:hypothetical protein